MSAVARGQFELLDRMADGNPWLDMTSNTPNTTSLILACQNGHTKIAQRLINDGANIETKGNGGRRALAWAAVEERPQIIKLLIKAGADVNAKNKLGETALMEVSRLGNVKIVKLLLDRNADLNDVANDGRAALFFATEENDVEIVDLLLRRGARADHANTVGERALDVAVAFNFYDCAGKLLKAGANPNRRLRVQDADASYPARSLTYLAYLVKTNNTQMASLFLEHGADPYRLSKSAKTAFDFVGHDNSEMALLLALHTADKIDAATPGLKRQTQRKRF